MLDPKKKRLYLYLDDESMTGYVGETQRGLLRHTEHNKSIKVARSALVKKVGKPVTIKADFNKLKAVYFAEHAAYEMYKEKGYNMLQDPPHPSIFEKYHDRIDDCKICDELGCDFTKERLEYILAVHRVSKLCDNCQEPFYFDPVKHKHITIFNRVKCCSKSCAGKKVWEDPDKRLKQSESYSGENGYWYDKKRPEMSERQTGEGNFMYGKFGEDSPAFGHKPWNKGEKYPEQSKRVKGENNPRAILTERKVRSIKLLLRNLTHRGAIQEIAAIYGVNPATIRAIRDGKSWKDIDVSYPGGV
jgi:hypothetical protein